MIIEPLVEPLPDDCIELFKMQLEHLNAVAILLASIANLLGVNVDEL